MLQPSSLTQTSDYAMTKSLNDQARILIIDDEPINLTILSKLLARQGYTQLVLIRDSREALDRYREMRPDLILLDIFMPHLDGYQVMEQLNALNDPLLPPIIIISAQSGREFRLKALGSGARDFVANPFDQDELLMRVRNLLDVHLAHRLLYDQKAVLEDMVRVRTEALQRTRLQVVRRLGRAAELRDCDTGMHIIRMSKISAALARHHGWSMADCELMLHASPMHDVGKIGIPDAILRKPGKLDLDEWAVMKTHTTLGADILRDDANDLLQLASVIAVSHHEKWDGSGYPNGLSEDAIPEAGRIVAVADVFDALISSRTYKEAWPVEMAIAYIQDNSGIHFDPAVAASFQKCLPEILAIHMTHKE